jgi:hypothetical protein
MGKFSAPLLGFSPVHYFLDITVPLVAGVAFALPFGALGPAVLAHKLSFGFRHLKPL